MVDRKGQLEAIFRQAVMRRDQPGIVHQNVEAVVPAQNLVSQTANRGQRAKIGECGFELRAFDPCGDKAARCFGSSMVAAGHDDAHPATGEAQRGIKPDSRTGASDDRHARRGIAYWHGDASLSPEAKDSVPGAGMAGGDGTSVTRIALSGSRRAA